MKEIKDLLEKFYEAETTPEEEKRLYNFFRDEEIPDELRIYKAQFDYYSSERSINPLGAEFDDKILNIISKPQIVKSSLWTRRLAYQIAGAAASIIIIISAYFIFNSGREMELKSTGELSQLSEFEIELAVEAFEKVTYYIDKAGYELNKFSIYQKSMEELDKVSYYEKYTEYINQFFGEGS